MEESLESMLEKLKVAVKPWDILTPMENDLIEAFRENEQVDIIYAVLVTEGLDESSICGYLKKVDNIYKEIEEEIPDIRELPHRKRGKVIFDKLYERYIKGKDIDQYKLSWLLDTGIGNCKSMSTLISGVMQRFGLRVVFNEYVNPTYEHLNIGLLCEDEEEKPIIPVESTDPTGYDSNDYINYIKSNYNFRFIANRDLRILCGDNIIGRGYDETEKKAAVDCLYLLKLHLIGHEFAPDNSIILFNTAKDITTIMLNSMRNSGSDTPNRVYVALIAGLLEHALRIRPEYEYAARLLSKVKALQD